MDIDLESIADQLNNRPRKTLGFATPNEVFSLKCELSCSSVR